MSLAARRTRFLLWTVGALLFPIPVVLVLSHRLVRAEARLAHLELVVRRTWQ